MHVSRFLRSLLFLLPLCIASIQPAPAQPAREEPGMRLGDAVRPVAYALDVSVDPGEAGFTGHVEIDVAVARPIDSFRINAIGLEIRRAEVLSGGQRYAARAGREAAEAIPLDFDRKLPAGPAKLVIDYAGKFSTNETRGIFKQQDLGEWYAFTQFESTDARRAFPSFDEPQWKTPWNVTLTVRREHVAVANAPAVSERELPGGLKQVRFATTQPLPSYLVAFGVGPFEVVDGGVAGIKKTHLRYIVPKGRSGEARYAAESTPRLLELLEDYFGRPYPFDKLDSMAIPITVAFSAMENPGLITYRSSVLLAPASREEERFQQRYASIAAHEMAHQWFGDLVTMTWWDDVWLNESFATWMSRKVTSQFNPAWEPFLWREHERQSAFETDRLSSTRQVREPVRTQADVENAFDRITYEKGGAVLSMFESWMGETAFRDGVRRYLKRHEYANASAGDFFAALGESDPALVPAFSSFVLQPGLPVVDVQLDCSAAPAIKLRQGRFSPVRGGGGSQLWRVPVCLRVEGAERPVCTMLTEREQRVAVPGAAHCPAWVLPNPGGAGYFLSRLNGPIAAALPSVPLSEQEAIALAGEQAMLFASGAQPLERLLDFAQPLARDARPEVATAAAVAIDSVNLAQLDARGRVGLAAWVKQAFGARAAQLGWVPRAGEPDSVRKLRSAVVPLVAIVGEDPALRTQAGSLARAWLAGDHKTMGAMARHVLHVAARDADAALFRTMVDAVRRADDGATRVDILGALGHLRDPVLLKQAFDYALSGRVDLREGQDLYYSASEDADNAPLLFAFVRERYDALAAGLPEESVARIPRWHKQLCSREDGAAVRAFHAPRAKLPGSVRWLDQTVETIEICAKARGAKAVAAK